MAIITLTTDFGTRDGYLGAMKGVVTRLSAADTTIVDIAHDIPRGDIAHAAWVVATACPEFPHHSIHIVVVDPGVGGARRGVIVSAGGCRYVGPDNGVFTYVADATSEAWAIEDSRFRARQVSPTFHGRDVFAWAAAAMTQGAPPAWAGPRVDLRGFLPWGPRAPGIGRIVHIDHFGNLVSDLPMSEAIAETTNDAVGPARSPSEALAEVGAAVSIDGQTLPLVTTYEDVLPGQLLAYVGSAGTIEIAVRDGSAAAMLGVPRGTLVLPAKAAIGPYR